MDSCCATILGKKNLLKLQINKETNKEVSCPTRRAFTIHFQNLLGPDEATSSVTAPLIYLLLFSKQWEMFPAKKKWNVPTVFSGCLIFRHETQSVKFRRRHLEQVCSSGSTYSNRILPQCSQAARQQILSLRRR